MCKLKSLKKELFSSQQLSHAKVALDHKIKKEMWYSVTKQISSLFVTEIVHYCAVYPVYYLHNANETQTSEQANSATYNVV
jgi:hypothetical protein